jgi:nucleoside-diphosphate-sugar epimerase
MVAALDSHDVVCADIAAENPRDALDVFRDCDVHFDLVVHCAAVAPHRAAIDGRALAVGAGNAELDAAMFRWAARTKPGRVVYFSSSAAYPVSLQRGETAFSHPAWPSTMPRPLVEDDIDLDDPEQPDAIYGEVKLMGERLAEAYRVQGGAVTILRPFSGYGEDQSADFPFGAFRDRARQREDPFQIWGAGVQMRDWVHVDDVVGAALAAVDQDVDGPVNIATGIGTSMADLARMFAREAGYNPTFQFLTDRPAGVAYRVGDPTLLHEFYEPKVTIAEGVKRALAA